MHVNASGAGAGRWFENFSTLGVGAVVIAMTALGILNIAILQTSAPASTFMLGVIISTWVGGTRAGLAAIALAALVLTHRFSPDPASGPVIGELTRVGYFLLLSGFLVWIIQLERRTAKALRQARDALQRHNEALRRENAEGKALEELLRRDESELRRVINTIPAMTWSVLPDGRVDFLNSRWLEFSGLTLEEALDSSSGLVHPGDIERTLVLWRQAMRTGEPFEDEMRLQRADGEYRWFLVRTTPLRDPDGRIVKWYGTSTDIEDRKRAEERLKQLSRRLLEVHEDERRHLSRELHDEFGQMIAAVGLHVQIAKATADEASGASLDAALALLKDAGAQVRGMALELRPTILETAGLDGTLRWLATQHEQRTGLPTRVTGMLGEVSGEIAIACFRVVQQALTNVVQHARAANVVLELGEDASALRVAVSDDGVGFDVAQTLDQAAGQGHLGFLGMRERALMLGGEFHVESRPGHGTRIAIRIPTGAGAATPKEIERSLA